MMLVVISLHLVPTALYNILQKKVREYTEGINTDMQVLNEKVGILESGQISTNNKLAALEASVGRVDKSLAAL